MWGFHQIFTRSIRDSLPIYPVSLSLLAFIPSAATVSGMKFDRRCHVNQITRKMALGLSPNFLDGIWWPLAGFTVNLICLYSYWRQLHCLRWNGASVAMWLQLLGNGTWDHLQTSWAVLGHHCLATLLIWSARIHIYGSYSVWGEMDHPLSCDYIYTKTEHQIFAKLTQQYYGAFSYLQG